MSSYDKRYKFLKFFRDSMHESSSDSENSVQENDYQEDLSFNCASSDHDHECNSLFDDEVELNETPVNELKDKVVYVTIMKILMTSGLSAKKRETIYQLIRFVEKSQMEKELPKTFKKLRKVIDVEPMDYLCKKFCSKENDFIENDEDSCMETHGDLFVFNMKKTLELLLRRNYEILQSVSCMKQPFTQSDFYRKLWSDFEEDVDFKVTLIINNDDARLTKSTKTFITPLSFQLAELPMKHRCNSRNIGLSAFWCGEAKISHEQLWQHGFMHELQGLLDRVNHFMYEQLEYTYAVKVGLIVMDSVAKAKSLNIKQFNGFFGCPYCFEPGKTVIINDRSRKHVYPYKDPSEFIMRTHDSYMTNARKAVRHNRPVKGIKGPTILTRVIDLPSQVPIDWMHCVLLGVFKQLLSTKPFCDKKVIENTSRKLKSINFPHDFKRKPDTLYELKLFKASVFKIWLFLLPPLFKHELSSEYLILLLTLSVGVKTLCKERVNLHDIRLSHTLLNAYILTHQEVFSLSSMNPNLHFLQHLSSMAAELGPITNFSAFPFEGFIYELKKPINGTRGFGQQIVNAYIDQKQREHFDSYMEFNSSKIPESLHRRITGYSCLIDELTQYTENDQMRIRLLNSRDISPTQSNIYYTTSRLRYKNCVYHARDYKKKRKSASFIVSFTDEHDQKQFGTIEKFIISDNDSINLSDCFAIVKTYKKHKRPSLTTSENPSSALLTSIIPTLSDMYPLVSSQEITNVIHVCQINCKIILIPVTDQPNNFWVSEIDFNFEHN
ncbi:uncharacterized protein LOC128389358 [Panonychus citri]|uniref:uncharacterized protein LOC128389358 n=1 Tax=Panonychus citri TaxID=50023 RepID=UPI0023075B3E|nr:uncharacterized protein LOC128389358 [Panonychus citri]